MHRLKTFGTGFLILSLTAMALPGGVSGDADVTPRGVGSYVLYDDSPGAGIHAYPYSTDMATNPLTYGDIQTAGQEGDPLSILHGVGTVWATAVWDMYWNLTND